jgi:hypothetical protein
MGLMLDMYFLAHLYVVQLSFVQSLKFFMQVNERRALIASFKAGQFPVLINCGKY